MAIPRLNKEDRISENNSIICPHCSSDKSSKIIYGHFDQEGFKKTYEEATEPITIRGCVVYDEDRHCQTCGKDFNSKV